jgi:dCTP deaminase
MTVLSDKTIKKLAEEMDMINPFVDGQIAKKYDFDMEEDIRLISYGLSSFGYDACLSPVGIQIYTNANAGVIDPKNIDQDSLICSVLHEDHTGSFFYIPPNSFALCQTREYYKIPRNCIAFVAAKSTYARCGIVVNATVLEPEWCGTITLELSNTTTLPAKVYVNEGIVQIIFIQGDQECEVSYADRDGKYMNQQSVTLPKV